MLVRNESGSDTGYKFYDDDLNNSRTVDNDEEDDKNPESKVEKVIIDNNKTIDKASKIVHFASKVKLILQLKLPPEVSTTILESIAYQ